MEDLKDFAKNTNLYELLGVLPSASEKQIEKAYRQKALKCHPDKNPNDPNAAVLFRRYSKAKEILMNKNSRSSHDAILKAKAATAFKFAEMDAKRRKFRDDLEKREEKARDAKNADDKHPMFQTSEDRNRARMDHLRKEAARQMQEERERLFKGDPEAKIDKLKLIVTWEKQTSDYDQNNLKKMFSRYGHVVAIAVLQNKAVIEFASQQAATMSKLYIHGHYSNYFKIRYAGESCKENHEYKSSSYNIPPSDKKSAAAPNFGTSTSSSEKSGNVSKTQDDFEDNVLERLRKAQEKKNREKNLNASNEEMK